MNDKQELLEIYKLHAELADSISKQRATANRFYILVLSGVAVLFSTFLQRPNGVPLGWLMVSFGLFGLPLTIAWHGAIRSYRQLNTAKFKVLHELEEKLAFPFSIREWDLLAKGTDRKVYQQLTAVESRVPIIFGILFSMLLVIGIYMIFWAAH